jgi:hypothetical protein
LATINVPATGGWESWQTITSTGAFASSGSQGIRIVNISGEFNVNSVNFVYLNSNIPAAVPVVTTANIIYLKGNNGSYVTYSGVTSLMTSTSPTLGTNEKFTVVDAGGGLISLRGSNGKYVRINPIDNKIYCNSTSIGTNQKFTLNDLCGTYSIQGYNNLYVSSENGSVSGLTCTRTAPSGWEYFNWDITGVEVLNTKSFENSADSFKIYPNPAQNFITVNSVMNEKVSVTIYDLNGREVIKTSLEGKQKSIDIGGITAGIYFMKIIGLENTETIRFIKN